MGALEHIGFTLVSILFLLIGISMIKFPQFWFELQKWKVKEQAAPSNSFLIHMRVGGVIYIAVAVVLLAYVILG